MKQAQPDQGFLKKAEFIAQKRALKEPVDESVWGLVNETQLWFIRLGLLRLDLVSDLRIGAQDLARQIERYGGHKYKWPK